MLNLLYTNFNFIYVAWIGLDKGQDYWNFT